MKSSKNSLLGLIALLALSNGLAAHAGDVKVGGTTLQSTASGTNYGPLPEVSIQAYRRGPVLPKPVISGKKEGDFDFVVPEGVPFRVVFYLDAKTVPEMQNLAGKAGIEHTFHVALLTVKDYLQLEKEGKAPPLVQHLVGILSVVGDDPKPAAIIRGMLEQLRALVAVGVPAQEHPEYASLMGIDVGPKAPRDLALAHLSYLPRTPRP